MREIDRPERPGSRGGAGNGAPRLRFFYNLCVREVASSANTTFGGRSSRDGRRAGAVGD
jgi:hypothetical protein